MKKVMIIYILLIFALFQSCSLWEKDGDIVKINYGTSFGECLGFCKNELTITIDSVYYESISWYPSIQTKTQSGSIDRAQWNYFKEELNTSYFLDLPHVIGCPDCADGGAEWLEVELGNGDKHKVTFEYMNEPNKLHTYISRFRELLYTHINSSK